MKVYCARYILNYDINGELVDWFDFKQEKDDKWGKTDYGYFRGEGWICDRAEDNVSVNNSLCLAKCEKYFETELSENKLNELETEMKKMCIVALENKRKQMNDSLTKQIAFISR